ncbi:MAG: pyridoxal-phosphate dependent enzyme [Candidatus Eisenbacteria bacterium]|nr:pyridoxal-phosphate dependent enzyme [Candidatus Eisenbacteria bacterium]
MMNKAFGERRRTAILDLIGRTPLLDVSSVIPDLPEQAVVLAKAELCNPGGSVKDRPALGMIRAAESEGLLRPGQRILEATSGNTGIALAMIGAALGYPVTICIPRNASRERLGLLRAYGADVVLTDPQEGTDGAIRAAREIHERDAAAYFYPDQYSNPANWRAHYDTTGPEIFAQTGGAVTHFVAGVGTSGTFMGVGRFLRETGRDIKLISMQPDSAWHGLEGMKHMESVLVPSIYDPALADANIYVATEEAQEMVRRLARNAGILAGVSSGGNVLAAARVAREIGRGVVVTILCDGGGRHLSDRFWGETPQASEQGDAVPEARTS